VRPSGILDGKVRGCGAVGATGGVGVPLRWSGLRWDKRVAAYLQAHREGASPLTRVSCGANMLKAPPGRRLPEALVKLEPVYLVAPRKQTEVTRRAALLVVAAWVGSAGVGVATGAWVWRGRSHPPEPDAGDSRLMWLLGLASDSTPIEELVSEYLVFIAYLDRHYRSVESLWRGVERLIVFVTETAPDPSIAPMARDLIQLVESGGWPNRLHLGHYLPVLRRRAGR
jgi:hypothetical protein